MVGKAKSATKAEKRRFQELQEIGCIACRIDGHDYRAPQIHHLVEGNRRLGHEYTVPLCPWHHQGLPEGDMRPSDMEREIGPSLARNKREFIVSYGDERELLERTERVLRRMRQGAA